MRLGAEPRRGWAVGALIVGAFLLVHLLALPRAPLTDDDDFYLPAGKAYADWIGRVVRLERAAFSRAAIDAAFEANHEHPPIAKYALGICGALFEGALGPVSGPRVGTVLFAALAATMMLVMAVGQLGWRRGLLAGGLGVGFLLVLPRFFLHARVATLDVPVAGMYAATAALALRAERSGRAALLVGPVFGLATATKLNAPFLVLAYLQFALLVRGGSARAALGPGSGRTLRLPSLPSGLLSMAILGPLTFFAVWPWMWFDVAKRVSDYVNFHLGHYGIYFLYFGQIYEKDPYAPWTMPFVMAAITVPVAVSLLAVAGLSLGASSVGRRVYAGAAAAASDDSRHREGELVLWLGLNAVVTLATVAFSGGAKYGGAKLFLPFFPFWCLLAGYGAARLLELASDRRRRHQGAVVLAIALTLGAGAVQIARFFTAPLSQYNAVVGGLRGATQVGFERQYYDLAFRDLVAFLSEAAPANARLHFLPNNWEYVRTFAWYRREGTLRGDLQVVEEAQEATLIVLTHERRFRRYGADLRRHRTWPVVKEKKVDGVPLWTVLRPPDSRRP